MKVIHSLFLSLILCMVFQTKGQQDLPVVSDFDVNQYMGHWYLFSSISSIVDFFCVCTQTNYTLDPTNSSKVNFDEYCNVHATWAPIVHSHSYAEIDPVENAKWTNVNPVVGTLAVRADYYIIDVDSNYQWALVGSRNRSNLYILTRTKSLSDDIYSAILAKAQSLGFDVSTVEKTNQSCDSSFLA